MDLRSSLLISLCVSSMDWHPVHCVREDVVWRTEHSAPVATGDIFPCCHFPLQMDVKPCSKIHQRAGLTSETLQLSYLCFTSCSEVKPFPYISSQ